MHVILSRGFAGSERYAAELANTQCGEHEVMLVVRARQANRWGATIRKSIGRDVEVTEVPPRWFTQRRIARIVRDFRPDVIHTHLRRAARLVGRIKSDAATIATLHISVNGPEFLRLDGLICNAHWQKKDIPPEYHGLTFKLHQLFTPHRKLNADQVAALRRELQVEPQEFLVGAVGRLAESKGFDILIEAFREADLPCAKLVIIGDGRERSRLERRAGPNVSLPGFRENVKDYYQAFDLFVCPSRREPLPLVMLEAFDAGVPIVASTADGCRELIEEYCGELFPVGNPHVLAKVLAKAHRERPARTSVDLTPHYIDNVNRTIIEAYRAVIAHRNGAGLSAE